MIDLRTLARLASLALFPLALACASAARPPAPANPALSENGEPVSAYVSLIPGNAWTYEVKSGARSATDTVRLVGQDGPWFLDDHRGRLRVDDLGLRDAERYLLRGPLLAGKSWTSVEQMAVQKFEIVSIDAAVQTRAGLFERCVVVRNSEPLPQGQSFVTDWTYAPGVGLISMRTRTVTPPPAGTPDAKPKEQEQLRLSLVKFEKGSP